MMGFWVLLWKTTLVVGLAVFAGMAVWVTIGGARDIKRLLKRLDEQHKRDES
ncbi:MAG TPA: hypothetical protein VMY37_04860 [Thermoguttaceae bacterium]|nr:hypothetical protein [Thermoguttaceae bacterium]